MEISRAFVVRQEDKYHYRVRIPTINKGEGSVGATPDRELYTATVCAPMGTDFEFKSGDVVFVAFESSNYSYPVIVGMLLTSWIQDKRINVNAQTLDVSVDAVLPEDTTIGNITPENIKMLDHLGVNVAEKFAAIDSIVSTINTDLSTHSSKINTLEQQSVTFNQFVIDNSASVQTNANNIELIKSDVNSVKSDLSSVTDDVNDHMSSTTVHVTSAEKSAWDSKADSSHSHSTLTGVSQLVLTSSSYGQSLPQSPVEGQLYFLLES